jgi:hypothetical protein
MWQQYGLACPGWSCRPEQHQDATRALRQEASQFTARFWCARAGQDFGTRRDHLHLGSADTTKRT